MNNIKEIEWIEFASSRYGGVWYNQQSRKAISKHFDLELVSLKAEHLKNRRYLKFLELFYYLLQLKGEKDLWIRDFYSVLSLSRRKTKGKNLALIFHIDFLKFPLLSKIPLFLMEKLFFYRQLRKVDAILTISEYWKNYFLDKGYKNVYKIYCGFDLNNFNISDQEVIDFKKKYNLESKPIIYLGNCQKAKGVVDAWHALKGMDAHLVTSGKRHTNVPTLNLDLDYRDYLKLLKASSVVLTMSKFKEGWCITAHEAMLLKTPVIGSGLGGQHELLEGGNQIICKDFKNLREKVEYLLNHKEASKIQGEKGFNFAKNFTVEKFEEEWTDLIKKIINLE
jgi:glycosyltransferase involved in cell wall biosynthesis